MPDRGDTTALVSETEEVLKRLAGLAEPADLERARPLVLALRNAREYDAMGRLAEAVSRLDPKDATNRRLYAQYLIDTGKATAAIDLLRPLVQRLAPEHLEFAEAAGLLGRAHKQIFFDAGDKTSPAAREALKQAIAAYRKPYERNPANTWHGVNLLALVHRARGLGLRVAPDLVPKDLALTLLGTLAAVPEDRRDAWYFPTVAEVSLGLGDWPAVEKALHDYVAAPDAKDFLIASTLRQFSQVWDIGRDGERGSALLNILRARLAQVAGGGLTVSPAEVAAIRAGSDPPAGQLEAVLGSEGVQTYRWMRLGLDRALSVAAVRQRLGNRVGTGFAVRAAEFGMAPGDEVLVLTNFHVVNPHGAAPGLLPQDAEVAFEAADAATAYPVKEIVWSSPVDRHDAALLRLAAPAAGIAPLPIAATLPLIDDAARVYVIGHPGGRDLAFSLQDNQLIDHEGPPAGAPQIPGVCRVHYRAPTEGGSSGSPVFNAKLWEVIALHHKGGKMGMGRLNGKPGTYAANEGVSMASIIAAVRDSTG